MTRPGRSARLLEPWAVLALASAMVACSPQERPSPVTHATVTSTAPSGSPGKLREATRTALAAENAQIDRDLFLAPYSEDQARSVYAGKLSAEFRRERGALSCVMRGEGKPYESELQIHVEGTTARVLMYGPCFHIGPFAVGLPRDLIETNLGEPFQTAPLADGLENRVYVVDRTSSEPSYFVITYQNSRATAVQFTGGPTTSAYTLSGLALGNPADRALEQLGPSKGRCPVAEISGELWSYSPLPLSLEIKDGRIYSMRVGEPAPPSAQGQASTPDSIHLQSEGHGRSLDRLASDVSKIPGAVADRSAAGEVAWPANVKEYEALGRHAVMLVRAATQDRTELPVANVYIRTGGGDVRLERIGPPTIYEAGPDTRVRKVLGRYREDSFYLLPISMSTCIAGVFLDFAKNRTGFELLRLPLVGPPPPEFPASGKAHSPSLAEARTLILREFPDAPLP